MTADDKTRPHWNVSSRQRRRAKSLRTNSTDAEQVIWSMLRAHRLNGASFRRQVPIGPYIADFVRHAAALVIEIDGGQHFEQAGLARDARRDAFLEKQGFRVLRFNNYDVLTNRMGVAEVIAEEVARAPSPPLPRKRGREPSGVRGENEARPSDAQRKRRRRRASPPPLAGEG